MQELVGLVAGIARLAECQATAQRLGAERLLVGATSASRDASNVAVLIQRVRDELGLDYRILSGEEEASLVFRGALALLPDLPAACVLDVGGGSTELVAGPRVSPTFARSVDVGSVRLTERHFAAAFRHGSPPAPEAVRAAEAVAYERYLAERPDEPALDTWMRGITAVQGLPPDVLAVARHRSIVGMSGYPLVGTAPEIADRLAGLSDAGLDGVLLTWVNYADGLARFNADVLPLLEQAGLRE